MGNLRTWAISLLLATLCGCQGQGFPLAPLDSKGLVVKGSYLKTDPKPPAGNDPTGTQDSSEGAQGKAPRFRPLVPLTQPSAYRPSSQDLGEGLSTDPRITLASEAMPARDFIHYVFGELLKVSYVIDSGIGGEAPQLTLNMQEPLSAKRLFTLALQLLTDNGIQAYGNDGVLYFREGQEEGQTLIGVGRRPEDVPNTAQQILQIVPVTYGAKLSTERTLGQLTRARVLTDLDQNAYFVTGTRSDVLRAVELIGLLDSPANRGRHLGVIELTFIDAEAFEKQLRTLLLTEGIEAGLGGSAGGIESKRNIVLVPLPRLGATAVFATSEMLLERVRYWASVLDKPAKGASKRYFTFTPQNARASDIFTSLAGLYGQGGMATPLMGASASATDENRLTSSGALRGNSTGNAPAAGRTTSLQTEELSIVVDERSNTIVLYCSGSEFQTLYPLLQQLDILPKQVVLDIMIAEVTLQDEFRLGVEWALRQNGIDYTTQGALGASSFAGLALAINEDAGLLDARALATNSLVNVVSNPTLLVRDGVTATINVGSDISVIGNTTVDPIIGQRQTVASEYRKTGVDVTIRPTINASDIVIMDIAQTISNTVPGSTGAAGNPDIFERALETQVIAKSGQTIMLGGLISQDSSQNDQGVPFLKDLPLLGNLAKGQSRSRSKTELIMLVTARVLQDTSSWSEISESFRSGLESLELP